MILKGALIALAALVSPTMAIFEQTGFEYDGVEETTFGQSSTGVVGDGETITYAELSTLDGTMNMKLLSMESCEVIGGPELCAFVRRLSRIPDPELTVMKDFGEEYCSCDCFDSDGAPITCVNWIPHLCEEFFPAANTAVDNLSVRRNLRADDQQERELCMPQHACAANFELCIMLGVCRRRRKLARTSFDYSTNYELVQSNGVEFVRFKGKMIEMPQKLGMGEVFFTDPEEAQTATCTMSVKV